MRRMSRRSTAIPLVLVALALGLSFNSTGASANSGHKNVYSEQSDGLPEEGHTPNTPNNNTAPVDPNAGKVLYENGCSTCHGVQGNGSAQGPALRNVGYDAVDFYVSSGRMPLNAPMDQAPRRKPVYTPEQIHAMASYVATAFGQGPRVNNLNPESGNLVEGNLLYTNNCAACHNSAGSGGALGGSYYAPNLFDATPEQVAQAMRVGPGAMPVFGPNQFSDAQVNSIVRYVGSLHNDKNPGGLPLGHVGPVPEGLIAWVVGLGLMLAVARWIGTRV